MCFLPEPADNEFVGFIEDVVLPYLAEAGAAVAALLETESATNTFPALPVREGEHVVTWFSAFDSIAAHAAHLDRLAQSVEWRDRVLPELTTHGSATLEELRLAPTARSALR